MSLRIGINYTKIDLLTFGYLVFMLGVQDLSFK